MITFREYFLTEGFNTKEQVFWETIYHEMWWEHIQRAVPGRSSLSQGHKDILKREKPGFVVTGPKMQVEFYEVIKVDIQTGKERYGTVIMKENRAGMDYPDSYYIINDYDLKTVKEWWEENWNYLINGPGEDDLPPDPSDAWKG